MRPIKVEFQAFGPYADHEIVDFEDISSKGLFLICGRTGIGKTMIIDAMTFALYGKSSGNGRDDFGAMRCTRADFKRSTFVRFEFEHNGERYRFERGLERKTKNLVPVRDVSRLGSDGTWNPLFENTKEKDMNEKAEEIIGLSYDQFRQVIVLPQGQFEKLLTSNSKDKETILANIFGTEKWGLIAENIYREANDRKNKISSVMEKIKISLAEEDCRTTEELDVRVGEEEKKLESIEESYRKMQWDKVIEEQQKLLAVAGRFSDLHGAEKKVASYEARRDEYDEWIKRSEKAGRAESVRKLIEEAETADELLRRRIREADKAADDAEKMKTSEKTARDALASHLEKEGEIADLKEKRAVYEEKREDYKGMDEAEEELKAMEKEAAAAERSEKKARADLEKKAEELVALNAEYKRLSSEHLNLQEQRISGIAGELAGALTDGEACPVCGSTSHPHKAKLTDEDVTKEDVDRKKAQADEKLTEVRASEESNEKAKADFEKIREEHSEAKAAVRVAGTKLEALMKNLAEGIETSEELEEEISRFTEAIESFAEEKKRLEARAEEAKKALSVAETKAKSAAEERAAAEKNSVEKQEALKMVLEEKGFKGAEEARQMMLDPRDFDELKKNIVEFDAGLGESKRILEGLKSELVGKEEIEEEDVQRKLDEAIDATKDHSANVSVIRKEISRLKDKASALRDEGKGMEEKMREAEADLIFARKLRGDQGIGLERYVLGIMFSSVVAEANRLLEMVHGGRYRLFRTDEKGQGSKRGLELKVHDNLSDDHEGRFVGTLSGGEKFLTALALSIGMAGVAGRSGISIDALFIDEGFGTLDEDSIGDAMDILNSIQRDNGLVGIISHMQILRDNIPAKLRVEAGEDGSHIIREIG